ncbi:hypothetical protein F2Q68_00005603 [Brassica cretica]|uniref:Uncharacterized protein n=1 Tax=Brassica cretica TaxID=69181 RepID=A0A8S9JGH0_BRACR|nr:hypothetical protein F2Q68_00005603 [Brassica cretica]
MDGVPDLSALLKGKLQLLTKKSTTVDPQGPSDSGVDVTSEGGGASREEASREGASREEGPIATDQGGTAETSASGPKKKKKKTKRTKVGATDEVPPEESAPVNATLTDEVHPEESAPADATSEVGAASGGHLRKKTKRSVEAEPCPSTSDANVADAAIVDAIGEASGTPGSEGSVARRRCAELTRQIRGGTKEMPQLEDLYFKNEYIDAASSRARSDGSMNFLVEKYDSALKQTMIQLGSSEKLAQAGLKAIEKVRDEHKKANEKAAKEKEVLRVKFEELEGKLKSAGAAKKELARENTRLEQATATLEKEKTELLEERDAAVEKLIRERQRLRDSWGLEVTRERERVEAAMIEKANGCFGRVRDHLTRFDAFGKAKNLYGQASGTRKCLEMIKASGTEIPKEMIDVFIEQEKLYEAEATKLRVDPLSDSDLTLSPLVLPSRFVEDRFRASFDPYGSNVDLIGPGTSDGSMNFLVEKYDSALKQTMIQLGSSEKLAQARLKAIERVRDEHKKANEKAAKENEVLRVKDAAVEKLIRERQRLRDSQGLEVTRERERVEAAMIKKANGCFGRVRDHLTRLDAFGKAKNLYGQASGTRKCLEMIKASGTKIPQEMINVFIEQEKLYEAEATKLRVDPLSDSDLAFSRWFSLLVSSRTGAVGGAFGRCHVLEGGGPIKRPGNENPEEVHGEDNLEIGNILVREEEAGHKGIEDPVLISDSSSEGREGEEEEDDRVEETSSLQPVEEEKTEEVGNRDVPPPPAVDSLVSIPTQVEDPTVAEDPVGPSALGTSEEIGQDSAP